MRRVFTCKAQIPDSFPYVLEREFGAEHAQGYENYVMSNQKITSAVQNLSQNYQFGTGVDHMNQVISYSRVVYFGYIMEQSGILHKNLTSSPSNSKVKPGLAFGGRAVEHKEI